MQACGTASESAGGQNQIHHDAGVRGTAVRDAVCVMSRDSGFGKLNMNYTDDQLKQALAKMLQEQIVFREFIHIWGEYGLLYWKNKNQYEHEVLDTELLHLCWMVEETLTASEVTIYSDALEYAETRWWSPFNASWQQRVESLAKVKGINI